MTSTHPRAAFLYVCWYVRGELLEVFDESARQLFSLGVVRFGIRPRVSRSQNLGWDLRAGRGDLEAEDRTGLLKDGDEGEGPQSPHNLKFHNPQPCVLVAFLAGPCCDGYALRRVMDCGRLSLHSSLPELRER